LPKVNRYNDLVKKFGESAKLDEPLSNHTTFHVGGPADLFISPKDLDDLITIISFSQNNEIPYYIIGWGSNLLIYDTGFPGMIINMQNNLNHFSIKEDTVIAEAGLSVPVLIQETLERNLVGMDFMYGIPGTIGGCTCMNAGTNHHGIGELIKEVKALDVNILEEITLLPDVLGFEYHKSNFLNQQNIILSVNINLKEGKKQEELQKIRIAKENRRKSQPLQYPNAGCIWKNPPGLIAGKLIEEAGMKGYQIGGAQISNLHANFIINNSNAKAKDIMELMLRTEKIVYEKWGIKLEREIQVIGNFTQ
jgi:UDP-N-acetylmuramate dehydrogenase